jgi:hypothetical protein
MSKLPVKVEPQPAVKAKPPSDAKAGSTPKVEASPEPAAEPGHETNIGAKTLMNTTLGDILVAGILKDPEDAGRIIADGIVQTKVRIDAAKSPPAKTEL